MFLLSFCAYITALFGAPLFGFFRGGASPVYILNYFAQTFFMKITTLICCSLLIFFGLCATVFALTGWNLLLFLSANNPVAYRAALSLAGVSALWLLFWLVAFRPTKFLS